MAGNFEGWLIKFGDVKLPNSFLLAKGWESTPNQRLEIDANRDGNAFLHRTTSENFKTKIKLNIRETTLLERIALNNVISLAELPREDKKQRRVKLTYWNDETLTYESGVFYITDTTYTIYDLDEVQKEIHYDSFTMTLIQY